MLGLDASLVSLIGSGAKVIDEVEIIVAFDGSLDISFIALVAERGGRCAVRSDSEESAKRLKTRYETYVLECVLSIRSS